MQHTQTRRLSLGRAHSAQTTEVLDAYDRTVLHRAEATLAQILKVLDGREESKTSD